jgi:hypothetical protein
MTSENEENFIHTLEVTWKHNKPYFNIPTTTLQHYSSLPKLVNEDR